MFNSKALALTVSIAGFSLGLISAESASALSIFNDRANFQSQLGNSITDDYESAGYKTGDIVDTPDLDIFTNAAMDSVLGEAKYQTTTPYGNNGYNLVLGSENRSYCAGCNGSFILDFTQASVGSASGVFGVGLDILVNSASLPYSAFVSFGDGSTQNFALSPGSQFFGITDNSLIKSINFGLPNGGSTTSGAFQIDNLTIGSAQATAVPTPALLPGLIGLGAAALRKRKAEKVEAEV